MSSQNIDLAPRKRNSKIESLIDVMLVDVLVRRLLHVEDKIDMKIYTKFV